MDLAPSQLAALVAIADQGTFEAAARHLHVTPSAVSQRIRALESAVGRVVVQRTTPCRPTAAGEVLLRLARQTQLLYDEVRDALADGHRSTVDLPVAVNADSLATWFRDVVGAVAGWPDVALRLHVEDQAFSAGLLRGGDVLAAVTSEPAAVQGCSVELLGTLRYLPAAAPAFAERWRQGRGHDWAAMPLVVFNEKDALQHEVLTARGVGEPPVVHRVPTSADFHEAVRLGLGWGMIPEPQLRPDVRAGLLVPLGGRAHLDVALHWQRWRLDSPVLDRLTDEVRAAARASLRQ
ncbi:MULTISPECIES: LysR family transcriptional regulator ArgP [unclassified Nocardioides]|uniref:LysR family transcriptional regulator ArgP n=1 Tax=unclassified Nocardioides TaxID=2615069 RepID=UPI0009F01E0E|nr:MULTISPECIES: LysR family transcriptional regulator ArgP [unclassified Nocardioides]GAW52015.1 chromosome replication initiation inhibitor protein [Nocardioides sp. PD653-B2]GAW56379.1 chromosome replication initiation inhibitor protein [Nocardioides sp. PD653]